MAETSNGWHFKRGLGKDFVKELESIAKQAGWFAQVLADPDLILGIRDNYLNVYWHGQSLFKIEPDGKVSTHPKYLIDPGLSKAVRFDGKDFHIERHDALTAHYDPETTLKRMKRAADKYAGGEKKGVHAVVRSNENVIDTEVTFNAKEEEDDERITQRIDLADFEEENGQIRLRFWEAKLYSNGEIRAEKDVAAAVVGQVRGYRKLVETHQAEIVESYRTVAENLVKIASWVTSERTVGKLVKSVAAGADFAVDNPPMVGLVVYGYDGAAKGSNRWKTDMAKLERETLMPICRAGDPKGITLHGSRP